LLAAKSVVSSTRSRNQRQARRADLSNSVFPTNPSKATLGQGGYITEPVGRGEIELGIHQINEILPVKGVKLVGPLPDALQKYTVYVGAEREDRQEDRGRVHRPPHRRKPGSA
jgi:molybdate transport system substrate-binding protein